ncbi:MAG: hypothetical protein C5B55_07900 [Blastocatellia bacterium]|nr:MAG: hypothetical protein C5B55_07900 [Blastocatellia bacterium]
MSYDEEQARRSRVVVETPSEKREVVESHAVRSPDRSGISAGMVGVLVVIAIALITMLVLFWMSNQQNADQNANTVAATQPAPTTVIQQPAQPPPVIVQQPPPATAPAPVIISPGTASGGAATTQNPNDDATIQMKIDKQFADDPSLSSLGITATVMNGKVTLVGQVKSEAVKSQVEKTVRRIKGVKEVDNQISVVP